ncbi:MAG TPA: chemotaxis protein CheA [Gemmatimonadota bacterium]|nr:chemotaxis protein CheA [Gemmatimonadota bacterium]
MSQQEKYAELFAAEAREHLAEMSRALIALESAPDDRESLDSIFRSVHTIKGMAAAMGYDAATRLAHNIESVLDELRHERRAVDSGVIDLLLKSNDGLEEVVVATVEGGEPADPAVLIEQLILWRVSGEAAVQSTKPGQAPSASPTPDTGAHAKQPAERRQVQTDSRVRVDIRRLDALMNLIGEMAIVRGQLRALAAESGLEVLQDAVERAGGLIGEIQAQVVESRMVPVWQIFDRFPRVVRDAARMLGKETEFVVTGKNLELDRALLDAIGDPLVHLLRNAVDHGIEPPETRVKAGKPRVGRIELLARRERSRVIVEVRDDGRGIDKAAVIQKARQAGVLKGDAEPSAQELFRIMARPGFSTAEEITELSGRGVGLDVVNNSIRGLGGAVEVMTEKGAGTTFRMELPLTLAILRALLVEVGGQVYAVPATFTRESFLANESDILQAHGREWVDRRSERLPLTRLRRLFANGASEGSNGPVEGTVHVVALEFGGARLAISVDGFVGEEEIVVKSFKMPRGAVPVFSGATVRPNGKPALVLDVGSL